MVASVCIFQFCVPVRILKRISKDSGHAPERMLVLFLPAILQAEIMAFGLFLLTLCPVCFNQGKADSMHAQPMSSMISWKQEVGSNRYCQALVLCISTKPLCLHEDRAFSPSESVLVQQLIGQKLKLMSKIFWPPLSDPQIQINGTLNLIHLQVLC